MIVRDVDSACSSRGFQHRSLVRHEKWKRSNEVLAYLVNLRNKRGSEVTADESGPTESLGII